jgi:hypothetical protein
VRQKLGQIEKNCAIGSALALAALGLDCEFSQPQKVVSRRKSIVGQIEC